MDIPTVYKFTRSEYRDDFLSGKSIRVGTLTEYRGMDDPASRYWKAIEPPDSQEHGNALHHLSPTGGIDDPLEGRTLLHVDRLNSGSEEDQARAKVTHERIGFDVFDGFRGPGMYAKNWVVQIEVPNYFIFCCSKDLSEETVKRMRQDSEAFGGKPYDIAIPILDMNGFLNAMTYAVCRKMKMFGPIENYACLVEYSDTVFRVGDTSAERPSALRKHTFFTTQNEFRFVIDRAIPREQKAIFADLNCDTTSMFGTPIEL